MFHKHKQILCCILLNGANVNFKTQSQCSALSSHDNCGERLDTPPSIAQTIYIVNYKHTKINRTLAL